MQFQNPNAVNGVPSLAPPMDAALLARFNAAAPVVQQDMDVDTESNSGSVTSKASSAPLVEPQPSKKRAKRSEKTSDEKRDKKPKNVHNAEYQRVVEAYKEFRVANPFRPGDSRDETFDLIVEHLVWQEKEQVARGKAKNWSTDKVHRNKMWPSVGHCVNSAAAKLLPHILIQMDVHTAVMGRHKTIRDLARKNIKKRPAADDARKISVLVMNKDTGLLESQEHLLSRYEPEALEWDTLQSIIYMVGTDKAIDFMKKAVDANHNKVTEKVLSFGDVALPPQAIGGKCRKGKTMIAVTVSYFAIQIGMRVTWGVAPHKKNSAREVVKKFEELGWWNWTTRSGALSNQQSPLGLCCTLAGPADKAALENGVLFDLVVYSGVVKADCALVAKYVEDRMPSFEPAADFDTTKKVVQSKTPVAFTHIRDEAQHASRNGTEDAEINLAKKQGDLKAATQYLDQCTALNIDPLETERAKKKVDDLIKKVEKAEKDLTTAEDCGQSWLRRTMSSTAFQVLISATLVPTVSELPLYGSIWTKMRETMISEISGGAIRDLVALRRFLPPLVAPDREDDQGYVGLDHFEQTVYDTGYTRQLVYDKYLELRKQRHGAQLKMWSDRARSAGAGSAQILQKMLEEIDTKLNLPGQRWSPKPIDDPLFNNHAIERDGSLELDGGKLCKGRGPTMSFDNLVPAETAAGASFDPEIEPKLIDSARALAWTEAKCLNNRNGGTRFEVLPTRDSSVCVQLPTTVIEISRSMNTSLLSPVDTNYRFNNNMHWIGHIVKMAIREKKPTVLALHGSALTKASILEVIPYATFSDKWGRAVLTDPITVFCVATLADGSFGLLQIEDRMKSAEDVHIHARDSVGSQKIPFQNIAIIHMGYDMLNGAITLTSAISYRGANVLVSPKSVLQTTGANSAIDVNLQMILRAANDNSNILYPEEYRIALMAPKRSLHILRTSELMETNLIKYLDVPAGHPSTPEEARSRGFAGSESEATAERPYLELRPRPVDVLDKVQAKSVRDYSDARVAAGEWTTKEANKFEADWPSLYISRQHATMAKHAAASRSLPDSKKALGIAPRPVPVAAAAAPTVNHESNAHKPRLLENMRYALRAAVRRDDALDTTAKKDYMRTYTQVLNWMTDEPTFDFTAYLPYLNANFDEWVSGMPNLPGLMQPTDSKNWKSQMRKWPQYLGRARCAVAGDLRTANSDSFERIIADN